MSSRTSPQAGVLEIVAAKGSLQALNAELAIPESFRIFMGIATSVCALARNDMVFRHADYRAGIDSRPTAVLCG